MDKEPTMDTKETKRIMMVGLRAANRIRRYLGLPPVKELYGGNKTESTSCPITNTIYDDDLDRDRFQIHTGFSYISVWDKKTGKTKNYTNTGRTFVREFDKGHLPSALTDTRTRIRLVD